MHGLDGWEPMDLDDELAIAFVYNMAKQYTTNQQSACDLACEYQHNANVTHCDAVSSSTTTTTTTSTGDATDTNQHHHRRQATPDHPHATSAHDRQERPRALTAVHEPMDNDNDNANGQHQ